MKSIVYKNSLVWVGETNSNCSNISISNFVDKLEVTFIGSQNGASVPASDPFQANIGVTYPKLECGIAGLIYSTQVPYEIGDIVEVDYKEDKGRISVSHPTQFVFNGNKGQGTYKITSQFKNNKPVYKNGIWYLWYNGSNWILSKPSPNESGESYVQSDEPWSQSPTPTPANQIPDVVFPNVKSPTNDKTPTWTWNDVSGASKYEVLVNQTKNPNTTGVDGEIKTIFTNSYTETQPLSDGTHDYYFRAVNNIGSSMWVLKSVIIDTAPGMLPSAIKFPTGVYGWGSPIFTSDTRPEVKFEIHGLNIAQISIDGSPFVQLSVPFIDERVKHQFSYKPANDLDAGLRTYFIRSVDSAGNRSQYNQAPIFIDTTPPDVPVVSGTTPTTTTPVWNFNRPSSSPGASLASLQIKLNGDIIVNSTTDTSYTGTGLVDGKHKLSVRSFDTAGNYSEWSDEYEIVYDSTAPARPNVTSEETLTTNLRPTWTWDPIEDAVLYEIRFDGTTYEQTGTSFTPQSDISLPNEQRTIGIEVRSKDAVGNYSGYASFIVKIDRRGPTAYNLTTDKTTETQNYATHIKRPTFSWNCIDEDLSHFIITLNGSQVSDNYLKKTFQPTEDLKVGYNTFQVRPVDKLGNKNKVTEYGLRIFEPIELRWHMIDGKNTLQSRKFEKPSYPSFPERDTIEKWSTVYIRTSNLIQNRPTHRLGHSIHPSLGVLTEYKTYNVPLPTLDNITIGMYNKQYWSEGNSGVIFRHINITSHSSKVFAYKRGEDKTYDIDQLEGVNSTHLPYLVLSEMDTEDYENSDAGNLTLNLYSVIKED